MMKWDELPAEQKNGLVAEKVMNWKAEECDGKMGELPVSPDSCFARNAVIVAAGATLE